MKTIDVIAIEESSTSHDFAKYLDSGERLSTDFGGSVRQDQNGDFCILDSIPPAGYTVAPKGTRVVRFVQVRKPSVSRRSIGEFLGYRKELVGTIVDVRFSPNGTVVRYDLDPIHDSAGR